MRKDQCYFCTSRKCYSRIVSVNDDGKTYDEVACPRHVHDLEMHSDNNAPGVMKYFISSTGCLKRGEKINRRIENE